MSFGFRNDCCRRQTSLSIAHRKTYDWVCNNIRERDVRPASILPGLQWIRIPALEERIFALPRGDRALATVPLLFVRTSRMAIQFRGKATRKALAIIDSGETRSHGQRHAARTVARLAITRIRSSTRPSHTFLEPIVPLRPFHRPSIRRSFPRIANGTIRTSARQFPLAISRFGSRAD